MTESNLLGTERRSVDESRQDLRSEQPISSDLVVSHVDVDGMVAAAGLLRTLPDDAELRFTSYRLLPRYLEGLAARASSPRRIWVADLGIDRDGLEASLASMDALAQRGAHFYWFDHHAWDDRAAAEVAKRCAAFHVVPGVGRPATQVVTDVLQPGEAFSRLARAIVVQRASSSDPTASAWFRVLACLMVDHDWAAMHRAVRRLSRLEPLDSHELVALTSRPDAQTAALIGERMRVGVTHAGSRYATIDLRDARVRPGALRDAWHKQDLDFVVTIPHNGELIVDGFGARADLGRLAELERLDSVAHVCPHLDPIPIELAKVVSGDGHEQAVCAVIEWIDRNV